VALLVPQNMARTSNALREAGRSPAPRLPDGRVNVLLVDDQPQNLVVLGAILADLDVNLVESHSGEEAVARLREADFAVVLLDVQMREMDGFETAKRLRSMERSSRTPVIFLTAYDSDEFPVEKAYALGAVDYLIKPLVPVILRAKVRGFVDLFQQAEQIKQQAEQLREMERTIAEEALRQSEQRFARFMEHLPGLAWIKDLEGRYAYVNESAERAFGFPRKDIFGKTDQELFPPETAAAFRENDRRALECPAGIQVVERLCHGDGTFRSSIVAKFPVPGFDGKPEMVGGMAIDITDRLRAEEALQEADRRKDEFLATLAHELRNPLAPIRNALEIMRLSGNDAQATGEMRDMMERQVEQMVRLVDDLLDLSRISRGTIELRKARHDLADIVRSAVETSHPLIEAAHHQLAVSLPKEPLTVNADLTRLAQVVSNLLNNAAKYTPDGGHIWLTVGPENHHAVIRVRDDGVGIPGEMLSRVFDMFTQVNRALKRHEGGLGIGLTLVRRLIAMHGGTVVAKSAGEGQGSEFIVRLPMAAAPDPCAGSPPGRMASAAAAPRRRILVVDDNRDAAISLAAMLKMLGHETRSAHDGLEAVAAAAEYRPDLVLMDIGMPKLDGYESCRRMRQEPWGKEIILVALTGWGQDEDRRRSREAGFDQHLVKPVDSAAIRTLLADLINANRV
jgi:PAS domain S-box-containing protein